MSDIYVPTGSVDEAGIAGAVFVIGLSICAGFFTGRRASIGAGGRSRAISGNSSMACGRTRGPGVSPARPSTTPSRRCAGSQDHRADEETVRIRPADLGLSRRRGRLSSAWSAASSSPNSGPHTLAAVERTYGVPRAVVLGVWGMETNFGCFTGSISVVRALATLAYTGYRGDFFREELLTALQILEQDHIDRGVMLGSWAGRHGPDPVHAVELHEICGRRQPGRAAGYLELGAGRARLHGELPARSRAGSRACPGASRSRCRRASISAISARASRTGRASACGGSTASRCRARARRRCSCPAARAARPSSSPTTTP